ncbi:hypothetical protein ACODG4_02855 [Vagococcus fluvialis]|uniref:hypothetical protein n=1 Tax=Vagococcus fluvialis TaxID=2738 RepID=UPI003B58F71B
MINRKVKTKWKTELSDIILVIALVITMIAIIFSNKDLAFVLLMLLIIVLPGSCLLYWLDFRKQNKD